MTRQGRAGKAIGAAVICSALGGTASALLMIFAAQPIARWAVSAVGPAEVFAITALGLTIAATVGARSLWKGWLSVLAGMLLASVGTDPIDGVPRFTFGSYQLYGAIQTVALILGLFALVEIFVQTERLMRGGAPVQAGKARLDFPTVAEFLALKWGALRSTLVGFFAGIVPGVGAALVSFLSYGIAARLGRRDGTFGKGDIRGVVASETANNAATGAALIPMLALGLPGGALTAMMIGVFQLHGITPGPLIFTTHGEIVALVFAAMLFANIGILALGYFETRTVVQLLRLNFRYLAPFLLVISTVGAFAARNLMIDVWIMYGAGVAAFFLRRSGYSLAGIVLGLILGKIGEAAFMKAALLADYEVYALLSRPLTGLCLALAAAVFLTSLIVQLRETVTATPT